MNRMIISSYADEVVAHIKQHHGTHNRTYRTLAATGWKEITLDKPIVSDYKELAENGVPESDRHNYADTDSDSLLDLEEICYSFDNHDVVSFDESGDVILPTIQDCINLVSGRSYVTNALSQYSIIDFNFAENTRLLPLKSDPTLQDSDEDGLLDPSDTEPFKYKFEKEISYSYEGHEFIRIGMIYDNKDAVKRYIWVSRSGYGAELKTTRRLFYSHEVFKDGILIVDFEDSEISYQITNSYKYTVKNFMCKVLDYLKAYNDSLNRTSYTRTIEGMYEEWVLHNVAYDSLILLGFDDTDRWVDSAKHVDLDQSGKSGLPYHFN